MANNSNKRTESKEIMGLNRITKKRLLELCKKDKLYQTPLLNDVLYLHYQGFQCIEGLEDYTELKCLWLECNAISEIQGLENQTKLRCLFLQSNLIKKIENLECCRELDTINLSQNHIRKIENIGFDVLPVLNTLNISSNYLKDCEDLRELENCRNVSVLDLSNNRIDDILVVKIFAKMPELKVLVLQGNPVVSKIPQYRKTLILECKNLTYLDSRPVFPKDRACAEAWKRGGYEEERKENERWNHKERKKMRDSVNATIRMRNKFRKPEDQLTLLVSSDSEDDLSKTKRKRQQQELDTGADMELGIWEEVAGDDSKSETTSSSDMNVSSSTSVISTTDSNGPHTSATSKCNESEGMENDLNDEDKILNVDARARLLAESENMGDILEFVQQSQKEEALAELRPEAIGKNEVGNVSDEGEADKKLMTTEVDSMFELQEKSKSKDTVCGEDDLIARDEKTCENHSTENKDSPIDPNTLECTSNIDDISKDSYEDTAKAILRVTMNDLTSTATIPERRVQLQIETGEGSYEPFIELDEAMKTMVKQEDRDREQTQKQNFIEDEVTALPKTLAQIEYEKECGLVTDKMRKDLEKMSSSMDKFMAQLQKDKEERKQTLSALFTEKEANTEMSSSSSDSEAENDDAVDWSVVNRLLDQWNRDTKVNEVCGKLLVDQSKAELVHKSEGHEKPGNEENKDTRSNKEFMMPACDELERTRRVKNEQPQDISKQSPEKAATTSGGEKQLQDKAAKELAQEIISNKDKDLHNCEDCIDSHNSTGSASSELNLIDPKHTACTTRDEGIEYDPPELNWLTMASNQALDSLERETKKLTNLLQKLENKNNQDFEELDVESKCKADESAEDYKEQYLQKNEIINKEESNCKEQDKPIEGRRDDLLKKEKEEICGQTVVNIMESLEFRTIKPDMKTMEDSQTKSVLKKAKRPLSNTIRGVIDSINNIFKKGNFSKSKSTKRQRPVTTTSSEKSASLKDLVAQPDLKVLNKDTHQSLNSLLYEYKNEQSKGIQQMVDRVYAQKNQYDDTIELIDGKLMVVDKDTGEIKEMPQTVHYSSDSDVDYNTAQSEDEGACSIRPKDSLRYRPTQRRYAEYPMEPWTLEEGYQRNVADSEGSDDEFYSLDPYMKQNVYANIDKEFFDKLSFDHLKFNQQDEDHVVQCARSYEELKSVFTPSKEEMRLTEEENNLLEKMRERKNIKVEKPLQRIEEKNAAKEQSITSRDGVKRDGRQPLGIDRWTYRLPNKPTKLFEYKFETAEELYRWPAERQLERDVGEKLKGLDTTEIYGNAVYNFIHEYGEEGHKEFKDTFLAEEKAAKQIKESLNRMSSLDEGSNVGMATSAKSLLDAAKISEEEKNEMENNTDVEGIIIKKESDSEYDEKVRAPKKVIWAKDIRNLKLADIQKISYAIAELPDEKHAGYNKISSGLNCTTTRKNGCEARPLVIQQSGLDCEDRTLLEDPLKTLNNEKLRYSKINESSTDTSSELWNQGTFTISSKRNEHMNSTHNFQNPMRSYQESRQHVPEADKHLCGHSPHRKLNSCANMTLAENSENLWSNSSSGDFFRKIELQKPDTSELLQEQLYQIAVLKIAENIWSKQSNDENTQTCDEDSQLNSPPAEEIKRNDWITFPNSRSRAISTNYRLREENFLISDYENRQNEFCKDFYDENYHNLCNYFKNGRLQSKSSSTSDPGNCKNEICKGINDDSSLNSCKNFTTVQLQEEKSSTPDNEDTAKNTCKEGKDDSSQNSSENSTISILAAAGHCHDGRTLEESKLLSLSTVHKLHGEKASISDLEDTEKEIFKEDNDDKSQKSYKNDATDRLQEENFTISDSEESKIETSTESNDDISQISSDNYGVFKSPSNPSTLKSLDGDISSTFDPGNSENVNCKEGNDDNSHDSCGNSELFNSKLVTTTNCDNVTTLQEIKSQTQPIVNKLQGENSTTPYPKDLVKEICTENNEDCFRSSNKLEFFKSPDVLPQIEHFSPSVPEKTFDRSYLEIPHNIVATSPFGITPFSGLEYIGEEDLEEYKSELLQAESCPLPEVAFTERNNSPTLIENEKISDKDRSYLEIPQNIVATSAFLTTPFSGLKIIDEDDLEEKKSLLPASGLMQTELCPPPDVECTKKVKSLILLGNEQKYDKGGSYLEIPQNIAATSPICNKPFSGQKNIVEEDLEENNFLKPSSAALLQTKSFLPPDMENTEKADSSNFLENVYLLSSCQPNDVEDDSVEIFAPNVSLSSAVPEPHLEKHFPTIAQNLTAPKFLDGLHFPVNENSSGFSNKDNDFDIVQKPQNCTRNDSRNFENSKIGDFPIDQQEAENSSSTTKEDQATNLFGNSEANSPLNNTPDPNAYNSPTKPDTETRRTTPEVDILECNLEIFDCNDDVIDTITVNAELHYDFENV